VVLAIIGIVFGMSFPFFAKFTKGSKLKNAATTISTVLRTARSYAITKRKNYWVIINDQATSSLYYAVKIYQSVDGTIGRWYKLPQGVIIDQTNFDSQSVPFPNDSSGTASKPVVEFKPTGGATKSGSVYIKDSENNYKRIKVINVTGRVKVTDESP
jgi:Tfp pilus assembly protein FimT